MDSRAPLVRRSVIVETHKENPVRALGRLFTRSFGTTAYEAVAKEDLAKAKHPDLTHPAGAAVLHIWLRPLSQHRIAIPC